MNQLPIPNISKDIKYDSKLMNNLRDLNSKCDAITLKYLEMDTISKGEFKDAIAAAINNYLTNYTLSEDTKSELKKLFKLNMGDDITIEYNKLYNPDLDELDCSTELRETVQLIIIKRARELTLSMHMNPTI